MNAGNKTSLGMGSKAELCLAAISQITYQPDYIVGLLFCCLHLNFPMACQMLSMSTNGIIPEACTVISGSAFQD